MKNKKRPAHHNSPSSPRAPLSVRKIKRLLLTTWEKDRNLLPVVAMQIFAGYRTSEVLGTDGSRPIEGSVPLPSAASSPGGGWVIAPNSALQPWLKLFPDKPLDDQPIV